MPVPEFVLALREHIGTDLLWLSGVTAVVCRGDEVLLARRADNGAWTPVTGIIDPGEEPAEAAVREVAEETAVRAEPERLAMVSVTPVVTYPNGDRSQYLDITFRMRWLEGDPHPADGENTDVRWFHRDALPPMPKDSTERLRSALDDRATARFRIGGTTV